MADQESTYPSSSFYHIAKTPYGGRGAFASQLIPKGTTVLTCSGPYAHVILRKFRREACAWCFAYSFEQGKNKWSVKLDEGNQTSAGAWFCSNPCRKLWIEHYTIAESGIEWWKTLNDAVEKHLLHRARQSNKDGKRSAEDDSSRFLKELESVGGQQITSDFIEETWRSAEEMVRLGPVHKWAVAPESEFEMDTARFAVDGLSRKLVEELSGHSMELSQGLDDAAVASPGTWSDYLQLQPNELSYVQSNPYMLVAQIRIFLLLTQVVHNLTSELQAGRQPGNSRSISDQAIFSKLASFLGTPAVFRDIQSRDPGNVFGIWDGAPPGQESEMLGWGAYTFGSYFNHNCDPNSKKSQEGRAVKFYTLRDISPGEELSISYVDGVTAQERNDRLKEWFFQCCCGKCKLEMGNS